ncbi:MAG TPA: GtrA family protein [Nakamurella sp.]
MTLAVLTRTDETSAFRVGAAMAVLRRGGRPAWAAQLIRFGLVGGAASVVQLAMYAFLADSIGSQAANIASWLVSTLVATEAHRRYSFGSTTSGAESDHVVGILTSVLTLLLSSVALAALDNPTGTTGVLALIAVNGLVGVLRFVTLRWWMVGRRAHSQATPSRSRSSLVE